MARVYSGEGDFDKAIKEMQSALTGVPDDANRSNLEKYVKRFAIERRHQSLTNRFDP